MTDEYASYWCMSNLGPLVYNYWRWDGYYCTVVLPQE